MTVFIEEDNTFLPWKVK